MMAVKRTSTASSSKSSSNPIQSSLENEVALLQAILEGGRKPTGLLKHFNMVGILDKLSRVPGMRDVTPAMIWEYLETLYDLEASETAENEGFVREASPFTLPKKEFQALMVEMKNEGLIDASSVTTGSKDATEKKRGGSQTPSVSSRNEEATPKSSSKRPTRSTPSSTPGKRRK